MTRGKRLKTAAAAGTAAAVMLGTFLPWRSGSSLFFPGFILGACSECEEDTEEITCGFALWDLIVSLFG
ncbi:MAG: hypothetical protein IKO27_04225 [Ruminococcus sp.]|nr:hypothetical protein [Ruminococcus sp.]